MITILCAKPHVARYIQTKYKEAGNCRIPKEASAVNDAYHAHSTNNFSARLVHAPAGMVTFKADLHDSDTYLSQSSAADFAKSLENFFWLEFELFIQRRRNETYQFKDYAIKDFQQTYSIPESIYPLGHFRRQLHRKRVKGLKVVPPEMEAKLHPTIPNQLCWQMYRIYRERRISIRRLASCYGFQRKKIERIFQKINSLSVSKSDPKSDPKKGERLKSFA